VKIAAGAAEQDRYFTVQEAAEEYFQGKVSVREVYVLFSRGELLGFRVGAGKGKILIYASSLDAYRRRRENTAPAAPPPPIPSRRRAAELPKVRLSRLPAD
jgi:hypothetical protein